MDYVQHFLPFSFAEAASERRFFFCGCAGVRRRSSDASVRKASSTFVLDLADVSIARVPIVSAVPAFA